MQEEQRWPRELLRDLERMSLSTDGNGVPAQSETAYGITSGQSNKSAKAAVETSKPRLRVSVTGMEPSPAIRATTQSKKVLVLCFDGTGNKFQGSAADSNIVKIYSLLDRQDENQYHYYQPGIGTYVETSSLSQKSGVGRIKSWYSMS